ncbi:MAG: hypothetical protein GY749_23860 [Desulfobacteraceae bacterium]|nr:hypothetical protein [Desulfobacteraceae bacterium]MCP4348727.1 hypothetical protein [Desulfobacterales bacterium]
MPKTISKIGEINPGDIYEDSAYHPCLCMGADDCEVWGVSLVDGSYPRCEDITFSGIRILTFEEAWIWRTRGPSDTELEEKYQWWKPETSNAEV